MARLTLDPDTLAKLGGLRERAELCDESGQTLGFFQPAPTRDRELYKTIEIPVSEGELQRREQEIATGKGFTTAEVLAHLKSLEKP
jgi:hypothetical protein